MMKKKRHKEEKQINRKILKRKLYVYSSKKSKQTNKHITYYNGKWHCVYKIYVLPKVKANYYGNPLLYIISHIFLHLIHLNDFSHRYYWNCHCYCYGCC